MQNDPARDKTTNPRSFRSLAFDGAHATVRREQDAFREMLKTWRAPVQKVMAEIKRTKEPRIFTASEYSRVGMRGFLVGALFSAPMWMFLGVMIWRTATNG
jgi:hypothetical protein